MMSSLVRNASSKVRCHYYTLRGSAHTIQGVDYLERWLDFIQFMSGGPPVGLGTSGFYCLFVVDFI